MNNVHCRKLYILKTNDMFLKIAQLVSFPSFPLLHCFRMLQLLLILFRFLNDMERTSNMTPNGRNKLIETLLLHNFHVENYLLKF